MDSKPADVVHMETQERKLESIDPIGPVGTVHLIEGGELVLIPTPSPDPRGML
jgi:hypothetical protein